MRQHSHILQTLEEWQAAYVKYFSSHANLGEIAEATSYLRKAGEHVVDEPEIATPNEPLPDEPPEVDRFEMADKMSSLRRFLHDGASDVMGWEEQIETEILGLWLADIMLRAAVWFRQWDFQPGGPAECEYYFLWNTLTTLRNIIEEIEGGSMTIILQRIAVFFARLIDYDDD